MIPISALFLQQFNGLEQVFIVGILSFNRYLLTFQREPVICRIAARKGA